MQHTPESHVFLQSSKGQHGYTCSDSGYSGFFQSPQDFSQLDSTESLSSEEYNEMSKENQRLTSMPREKTKEPLRLLAKDFRANQQPPQLGWTETPKRQSSSQHRHQMFRPLVAVKAKDSRFPCAAATEETGSPCTIRTTGSTGVSAQHWISTSFDSLDALTGSFGSESLNLELDVPELGHKRRLFAQMRTSTRDDGKRIPFLPGRTVSLLDADFSLPDCNQIAAASPVSMRNVLSPSTKEVSQSPCIDNDQSDVLSTPGSIHLRKYAR